MNSDFHSYFLKKNIKIFDLYKNGGSRFKRAIRLKDIIKKEKIDFIQSYLSGDNILCTVAKFGTNIKHISGARSDYGNENFKRSFLRRFLDYFSWLLSDNIISNNNSGVKYLSKLCFLKKEKIVVINNGIRIPNSNKFNDMDKVTIGCLGNLHDHKNQKILIEAFSKIHPGSELLIAGDGIERENIINYLKSFNIEPQTTLLGKITDVTSFFNSINIFVHPSLREGSPNALLEAMAHKKLCIVSNIEENREALGESPDECFFEPNDSSDLANKINFWIKKHEYAKEIAKKNYLRIKIKFSISELINSHRLVYDHLEINE
tara:strand:+ start:6 stop:962 length:957 start_codon:yes stop_codon:yes gene_type:complete